VAELIDGKYFIFQMSQKVEEEFKQEYKELLDRFFKLGIDVSDFEFENGTISYNNIKFYIDRSTDKLYAYYKYDTSEKYLIHDSNSLEKAVKKIIKRIKLTEGKF